MAASAPRVCANSSTRRRRRSTCAPPWRERLRGRGLHRAVRGATRGRRARATSSPCGPVRWWPGSAGDDAGRAVPHRRRPHRQPQPAGQAASRPVRGGLAGGRAAAVRRGVAELLAGPRPRPQRPAVGAVRRTAHRAPAGPHRRPDPAGAAAGHPPVRRPQGRVAGSAAARQRGVGRRQRRAVVPRLRRRAGRRSTRPTCSAST